MSSLAMTADQVAIELEYFHRDGTPNGDLIRQLFRDETFPAPIDPEQPVVRWRWARPVVERYVLGGTAPESVSLASVRSLSDSPVAVGQ